VGIRRLAAVRRALRPLAAVLLLASLLVLAACGGDDDGGAATSPASSAPAEVVTNFAGDECSAREPDPAAEPGTYPAPPPLTIDPEASYTAVLDTSCGTIEIALDAEQAPETVNNFVFLAREGFYDGLTFHRVVTGFVVQGGDPEGDGRGGPGYTFADELPDDGYPPGSVAMANSGPDTNGSQFFIVTGEAPLPNAYSRFGSVTEGLDVARAIEAFADPEADPGDPAAQTPASPVYIYSITIRED
jgi:cyclophilin family peptidyl-prolyl cis-trans isomerase